MHVAADGALGAGVLVHAEHAGVILDGLKHVAKRDLPRLLRERRPAHARLHGDEAGGLELAKDVAHDDGVDAVGAWTAATRCAGPT